MSFNKDFDYLITLEKIYIMPNRKFEIFISNLTTKQLAAIYLVNHLQLIKRMELFLNESKKQEIKQRMQFINSLNKNEFIHREIVLLDFEIMLCAS